MTAKTHQIVGVASAATYFVSRAPHQYNPATFAAVLVFAYLAALLPDIDQPSGKLWHMLPFGDTLGRISNPFLEHRNITHSILGALIVGYLLHYLLFKLPSYWGIDVSYVFIAAIMSYFSHFALDLITNEGIPLLFPLHRFFGLPPKPFERFRVATGKWFENLIIFPAVTIYLIIYFLSVSPQIKMIIFK